MDMNHDRGLITLPDIKCWPSDHECNGTVVHYQWFSACGLQEYLHWSHS